jgi:Response regulator receiver domain
MDDEVREPAAQSARWRGSQEGHPFPTPREDEPRIVEFLTENLRDDDFSVLSAATGAEAIEMLGQSRPDVVLLDVMLPDMSGYDTCRLVRAGDGVNDPWDPDRPASPRLPCAREAAVWVGGGWRCGRGRGVWGGWWRG